MGNAMINPRAAVAEVATGADDLNQYLTFHVDSELFAVAILDVKEIVEVGAVSRVPLTPAFIRGVINLRGRVIPVLDLSVRLGRDQPNLTKRSCIVLVEVQSGESTQTLGMLVDEVNEVLEIEPRDMQPAPEFGADIRTDFIDRMGKIGDHFIVVLNVANVLSVEELATLNDLNPVDAGAGV